MTPDFIRLVREMREAQRNYHDSVVKTTDAMTACYRSERAVDKALAEYDCGQEKLSDRSSTG